MKIYKKILNVLLLIIFSAGISNAQVPTSYELSDRKSTRLNSSH